MQPVESQLQGMVQGNEVYCKHTLPPVLISLNVLLDVETSEARNLRKRQP
jgi:hypothetical protein